MSFIELNTDAQQYRVVIPRCKSLPPNPHIGDGLETVDRALQASHTPPSETGDSELTPESRDDKRLRNHLLAIDQRSFFTGSAAADLQAAHMISPIRRNVERKHQVEAFLTQQKLFYPNRSKFFLDDVNNVILLEASLRVQWELYGTFCFVPTEEDAKTMLRELRISNENWQLDHLEDARFRQTAIRPLDISKPPFARPHWEVVVLHPRALLPDGQPLPIAEHRSFYSERQTPLTTTTWKLWVTSGDSLSSLQEPDKYLDPFLVTDAREDFYQSPFCSLAMVINSHCKLAQFLEGRDTPASERVKKFAQLMSDLVTEIFFVPTGYVNVAVPPPSQPETRNMAGNTSNFSQAAPTSQFLTSQEPGYSHTFSAVEEGTDPTVGEAETPEIPDADGLTNSEFELVASMAQDPSLDPKARADAAITMLFGTRRYADPYERDRALQSLQ